MTFSVQRRNPNEIMKLNRLGCFHQSKLSFLRSFIREFKDWSFKNEIFELDEDGYGTAVYSVSNKQRTYSLICYANKLDDSERSDRVIATKWDAAFVIHDGHPSKDDIERLRNNVPKQEVGRCSFKELALSRANKSVRVFNHVVESLSSGKQPDKELLNNVGYLYRTTAVYGSGKFGLADRYRIKDRPEINGPFRIEMMLVYLVRQFTFDQVNHIAEKKNPNSFVKLDINLSRQLGIGNSTGLGMAPFIINHPALLHQWIYVREETLKQIREIKHVTNNELEIFRRCLEFSEKNIDNWNTSSQFQKAKIKQLKLDIQKFESEYDLSIIDCEYFWDKTYKWIEENLSYEGIEYIVSLMMEPYDNIVSHLVPQMSADEDQFFNIPTERSTKELKEIIEKSYPNILVIDFSMKKSNENFWFISKNKEEPRIANRFEEDGSQLEQPLAIARDIKELYNRLSLDKNQKLSKFLENNNDLRHIVRRCYVVEKLPYAEIQDNSIDAELMPIDMLRLKLSFFGAQKFDPRSDKWLRICMYQGAPLMHEINLSNDTWIYN